MYHFLVVSLYRKSPDKSLWQIQTAWQRGESGYSHFTPLLEAFLPIRGTDNSGLPPALRAPSQPLPATLLKGQ